MRKGPPTGAAPARFACRPPALQHVAPPYLRASSLALCRPRALAASGRGGWTCSAEESHGTRKERSRARVRQVQVRPSIRLGEPPVLKHPQAGDRISHTYHMDGMEPVHCLKLSFRLPLGRRLLISTFKLAYLRLKQRKPLCTRRLCLQKFETRSNFFSTSCFFLLSFD